MLLGIAFIVVVVGPLLLALAGWMRARSEPPAQMRWDFRLMAVSTLLYVLAFNLVFFVQELFLVLPKAFTYTKQWTPNLDLLLTLLGLGVALIGLAAGGSSGGAAAPPATPGCPGGGAPPGAASGWMSRPRAWRMSSA